MRDELLSTGEAAALLGVTSRTVARMVDRGDLPGYRIGRHRRVRRSAIELRDARTPSQDVAVMLGVLLAAQLIEDPDAAFAVARRNLERQEQHPTQSATWTEQWADIVEQRDVRQIVVVLTDPDDRTGLRQTHPFRGLISPEQRTAAFAAAGR